MEPLLNDQMSDLKPEQGFDKISAPNFCSTTQDKQSSKGAEVSRKTVCSTTPSKQLDDYLVEGGFGRFKLNHSTSLRLQCIFFERLGNIVAYVNLLDNKDYVLTIVIDTSSETKVEIDYILPTYIQFIEEYINESEFKDNLKIIYPKTVVNSIFKTITYPRSYIALYY